MTGASGHVGTILTRGLSDRYTLRLLDLREPQHAGNLDFRRVDLATPKDLAAAFEGLDAVIHLAGDPRPNAPEALTFRNNFVATSHVFDQARASQIKKLVFASSNFVHEGDIRRMLQGRRSEPIRLDTAPSAESLYARSKVFGEMVGLHLSNLGVQFAALRIGWTVPEDDPRPYDSPYMRAMFCSHRDLVGAFDAALRAERTVLVAFAISDNSAKLFDLGESIERLGFRPRDDSAEYFR
jgi:NAD+ dependent glucose-6-phosphate dehydrogenase